MKNFFDRIKRITESSSGVVMSEILVAFIVMMIGLSMLYTCMKLSSGMIHKSADLDRNHAEHQKLVEEGLVVNSYPSSGSGSIQYVFTNGYSLTLPTATITVTDTNGNTKDLPVFAVE